MTEVLAAPGNGGSHFASTSLHRSSSHPLIALDTSNPYLQASKSAYMHSEYGTEPSASAPSSAPSSPQFEHHSFSRSPSYTSTPASSLSLDTRAELDDDDDQDISFPSFEAAKQTGQLTEPLEDTEPYVVEDPSVRHEELRRTPSSEFPQTVQDDQARKG